MTDEQQQHPTHRVFKGSLTVNEEPATEYPPLSLPPNLLYVCVALLGLIMMNLKKYQAHRDTIVISMFSFIMGGTSYGVMGLFYDATRSSTLTTEEFQIYRRMFTITKCVYCTCCLCAGFLFSGVILQQSLNHIK